MNAKHYQKTPECKEGKHQDCGGMVDRADFTQHDSPCGCVCHNPKRERWAKDQRIKKPQRNSK